MYESALADTSIQTEDIITILIVDDHPLVRQALKNLISTQAGMKVIAEANNGKEAVMLAKKLMPKIIIMDISMPVLNGLEATRQIKAECPGIAILALTVYTDKEHVLGILEAGAAGYLAKVAFGKDVIRAIHAIASGEAVLTTIILQQILSSFTREETKPASVAVCSNLCTREIGIIKLAAKGLSNKKIGEQLNLSEKTIKSYLVDIFSKMNVSSRTEAVVTGLKAGLIKIGDLE